MSYADNYKLKDDIHMAADLHLHTIASDGSWSPHELVKNAREIGLSTISITDHDTIDGIEPALRSKGSDMEIISGIEFSTDYCRQEIHILGYGIDIYNQDLQELLSILQKDRVQRAQAMVKRLNAMGKYIDYSLVENIAGTGSVGRVHIAQALVKKGYANNINECFRKYIGNNTPAYVRREKLSPKQIIETILEMKGAAVLAHPGKNLNDDLIPLLKNYGLSGIEVLHPSHSIAQIRKYSQLAKKLKLLTTGGSDCHGAKGKDQRYLGTVKIPNRWVYQLKSFLASL